MAYTDRAIRPVGLRVVVTDNKLLKKIEGLKQKVGVRQVLSDWADEYLAFIHTRHKQHSSGAGDWPPISEATKEYRRDLHRSGPNRGKPGRRREVRYKGTLNSILFDLGQLYGATAPGGRGQIRKLDTNTMTIRAGISGTTVYYDPRRKTPKPRKTLGELANIHAQQHRQIIVEPDSVTKKQMETVARQWVERLLN